MDKANKLHLFVRKRKEKEEQKVGNASITLDNFARIIAFIVDQKQQDNII